MGAFADALKKSMKEGLSGLFQYTYMTMSAPSFTHKQKRAIFRRRPKEFRERWKRLYPLWRLHKGKRVWKQYMKEDRSYLTSMLVRDTTWGGGLFFHEFYGEYE